MRPGLIAKGGRPPLDPHEKGNTTCIAAAHGVGETGNEVTFTVVAEVV